MAASPRTYCRNYDSSDSTVFTDRSNYTNDIVYTIQEVGFSAPQGKVFKEWNSRPDGQGVSYTPGVVTTTSDIIYAIWESEPVGHAVTISYKGADIATMDASGVKTLLTGDTFCEDDIIVSYTAPSGGAQLYKINGAEHNFQSLTIDGTTYAEDYTNIVMGYAPEGATVSADMVNKFLLTGVTNDATGAAIPTTTQTVYGRTIYTFTMPASSVTVTTFYDD